MRVFSLEMFVSDTRLSDECIKNALESGWPQELHGKAYGNWGLYLIPETWTIEVPDVEDNPRE